MVHVVKKKRGNHTYLSLQVSRHILGSDQKKFTEHIAYLGREDKISKKRLAAEIKKYEELEEKR